MLSTHSRPILFTDYHPIANRPNTSHYNIPYLLKHNILLLHHRPCFTFHHKQSIGYGTECPLLQLVDITKEMSFLVQNEVDREYIQRLSQETRILKSSKLDWDVEEVTRFASLLKIQEALGPFIETQGIDGEMLFNLNFLTTQLELATDQTKLLPIFKLFLIAHAILQLNRTEGRDPEEEEHPSNGLLSPEEGLRCPEDPVEIDQKAIKRLREELGKINNVPVIQLSSQQVYRMAKGAELMKVMELREQRLEVLRKWSVDGFCLVCILPHQRDNPILSNYYSDEELHLLSSLSHIFLHLYYAQYWQTASQSVKSSFKSDRLDQFNIDFLDVHMLEGYGVKQSLGKSEYGFSQKGNSLRGSVLGQSVRGSVVGESVRGSALGESVYGQSERGSLPMSETGSIKYSLAGSVYASSQIMEDEDLSASTLSKQRPPKDQVVVASSSISEDNTENLGSASLMLPFNLLKLQPLQKIKISTMTYPFPSKGQSVPPRKEGAGMSKKESSSSSGLSPFQTDTSTVRSESIYDWISENQQVSESKVFNLAGAKFGRSPDNDFSYPDELSISGKHAQIVFRDESYFIRDLGSKTGTFLYISQQKPLVLGDEQIIQLSYEVEIKVVILKHDFNEGVIKFEFKKPDNEPPYRAILKNNNTVRIGKAEKSHIRLLNHSISSYHAEIKYEKGRFVMYDCNTRTGTWLRLSSKGVRSQDRRITKNDIFRLSSKKTFFVQDLTEHIHYEDCPYNNSSVFF